MVTLTKSKQQVMRAMSMSIIIVAAFAFFIFSDYQQTGTLAGFGWIGVAAIIAGLVAIGQQFFYFSREPERLELNIENKQVTNAANGKVLATFDQVTFFALSTNKTNALIECYQDGKMVLRLKRHYELNLKISDILAKYSHVEGVELKHIGLTR